MSRDEGVAEFTVKAVVTGVALGVVFGAANAYLGLRVGMTVSASIPAAVMTVAVFRSLRASGTILEANLSQTIASASTSLATGTIFTIPALFLWGMVPPYLQVVLLAFLGGVLGLSAMIPLRRLLIVKGHDELPYPEGTACAEVLRATTEGAVGGGGIFRGMAVGAAVKLGLSLVFLIPDGLRAALPLPPKAELALEVAPALVGVGYILGYRTAAVCVAGALISAVTLTPLIAWIGERLPMPLYPETERLVTAMDAGAVWERYVRYIGAGAVATAGIITVARGLPTMAGAVMAVARGLRGSGGRGQGPVERTDRDLPAGFVFGGVAAAGAGAAPGPRGLAGGPGGGGGGGRGEGGGARRRGRGLRCAVRRRRRPNRGDRRRLDAADLGDRPRDPPRHRRRLRRRRLDGPGGAGGRSHRGDDRGHRREQGGRHLAGPQDGLAGRGDARPTAARSGDRRRVRLLGGGSDGDAARQRLHLRLARDPGPPGHAHEDDRRGRPGGGAAMGPRPHRRWAGHGGHALR